MLTLVKPFSSYLVLSCLAFVKIRILYNAIHVALVNDLFHSAFRTQLFHTVGCGIILNSASYVMIRTPNDIDLSSDVVNILSNKSWTQQGRMYTSLDTVMLKNNGFKIVGKISRLFSSLCQTFMANSFSITSAFPSANSSNVGKYPSFGHRFWRLSKNAFGKVKISKLFRRSIHIKDFNICGVFRICKWKRYNYSRQSN